jgi:deoxycytidylate deaminase
MLARLRDEMSRVAAALRPEDSNGEAGAEPESLQEARKIIEKMLSGSEFRQTLKRAGFLDITEFGRAVHAEMAALMSCATRGAPTRGLTLFCTTFPCHNCTKHLVAAGVARVVFIEPYPKSRAVELHSDAISLTKEQGKVEFRPFVGIGPKR